MARPVIELAQCDDNPAWAVRPERVVNFPSHQGVGEKEVAAIVAAIRGGLESREDLA